MVTDAEGTVETDLAYMRANPQWYEYIGQCRINGHIYHGFRLK